MRSAPWRALLLGVSVCPAAALLAVSPVDLYAQQPAVRDSLHQHGDSLTRTPIELQAVTITAAPAAPEGPTSTVRISRTVIEQTPASDAYDLLRQAAGIEVHEQGQGPGFASDASVRGFSSDHSTDLALWVDGVPINEPINGHAEGYNDWSLLFPQAIQDIDVFKGPTSAVYGNFAMSGVVNVRTLERFQGLSAWVEPGSYGRAEGAVIAGLDHGTDNGGVFGIRGERQDGWRPHSGYDLGQAHARLVTPLSHSATLDVGAELYGTRWDSPGYLTDSQFTAAQYRFVENPTDGGSKRRAQERASVRVLLGPSLLWRSTVYATQGQWQFFLTTPPAGGLAEGSGSQTEEDDHRYGFGLTSALTWQRPRVEITAGTEGRWDHSRYQNWLTTLRVQDSAQTLVTARQASGALFVQSSADLTRHLRFFLGGRLDAADTRSLPDSGTAVSAGKTVFSPKFGALYHLGVPVDLYANVSRGFRQTDGVIEDPTLPFITEWAYETGAKVNTRRVAATIAVFRMDVSNEQTFDPVTLTSISGGASRRQGVELELNARVADVAALSADWTFNDARYRQLVTGDGNTLDGARVFNTAKYVGTVAIDVGPRAGAWEVRLSSNVVGPYSPFDEPGVVRPSYGLLHASGLVRIGGALIELGVRNLLDRAYRELEAGGFIAPGQPRTVFGTVRYAF